VGSKIEGNAPRATDLQSSLESKSSASPLFDDQSSIKYLLKGASEIDSKVILMGHEIVKLL
jgi:hypothetical protein